MKTKCLHLVATALLFLSYLQFNFAQAPTLGTAANFVIFSSGGAVGNTGALSHFTGDVGTNTGAITINVNVNGTIHNPDAVTIAAKADVLSLYKQLDTAKSTLTLPPTIGFGDTLYAGVDSIGGSAVIDSNLVLDAKGDPNAIFIIKIKGTLGTMDSANIILLNGALACNVFWKVEGAVDLVSGTTMKGTIVANSGAITIGDGVSLEGRALTSTAGAITTTNVLMYTPTGCGSAVHNGPAAPALNSTACYAIFSSNGQVSNAGVTTVIGDIGTNVGVTSGYNALSVTGMIHPGPDASTNNCKNDLITLYNYLNTLTADIELMYPAQFGQNLVLTPHTYILNAGTALTDTLYLNAEGNANAVFVIQIKGALSTSTFAKVVLMNGAQAKNIFWSVDGAVSINDYSTMEGTIVCNNGAINLTTGVTIHGRALTTTGALSTAAVTVTIPSGAACSVTVLPITLLYFRGTSFQEGTVLDWATANEQNAASFIIEQSVDQKTFSTIGTVAAFGTSTINKLYNFTDKSVATLASPVVYYRLKAIDIDGKFTYSNIVAIKLEAKNNAILFYPNPVKESATMMISVTKADRISYNIVDLSGKTLRTATINLNAGINTLNVNVNGLAAGIYNITIQGEQTKERIKFIKQD